MKKIVNWSIGIISICFVILVGYNIYNSGKDFFTVTIGQLMTVAVALYFAFYLTQKNADSRVQKEVYVKILSELQNLAEEKESYVIGTDYDKRKLTMTKRKFNNYTEILKQYSEKMGVHDYVSRIEGYVDEYTCFLGNHIDDLEYLSKSESELRRPLDLIVKETIEIMMKLYK